MMKKMSSSDPPEAYSLVGDMTTLKKKIIQQLELNMHAGKFAHSLCRNLVASISSLTTCLPLGKLKNSYELLCLICITGITKFIIK